MKDRILPAWLLIFVANLAIGQEKPAGTTIQPTAEASRCRWKLEPFALSLSNVPVSDGILAGPARFAMMIPNKIAGAAYGIADCAAAADGTVFLLEKNLLRAITKDGQCCPIFHATTPGFRDGPAESALFDIWGKQGHYNCRPKMACDSRNRVYITDNGNDRLRRVCKKDDGKWYAETVAGGGARVLKDGESAPGAEVKIANGIFHVALASDDHLWVIANGSLHRYTPSDGKVTRFRWWSDDWNACGLKGHENVFCYSGTVYDVAGDSQGRAFMAIEFRGAEMQYYRIDQDGKISFVAGAIGTSGPYAGDPKLTRFWTVAGLAAPAGDPFVYMNWGDENVPRRVAKDGSGQVQALFLDGCWRPTATGRPAAAAFWSLPPTLRKAPADLGSVLFFTGIVYGGNDGVIYVTHRERAEYIGSHTFMQKMSRQAADEQK